MLQNKSRGLKISKYLVSYLNFMGNIIVKLGNPNKKFRSRNKYTCIYKLCTLLSTYNCSVLFSEALKKVDYHTTHAPPNFKNSIQCNSSGIDNRYIFKKKIWIWYMLLHAHGIKSTTHFKRGAHSSLMTWFPIYRLFNIVLKSRFVLSVLF